ncbi:MAG: sodium:pantothenate symporter [Clostridia bacterium]|nr:sodium:pantothenate symporter [Clostridia bacterium]
MNVLNKTILEKNVSTFKEDPRYKQCNKEALYGVILGIANMIWWYVLGYGLGSKPVEEYTYILGFPSWFFYSCILGAVVFIALTFIVVDKGFKNMPLDRMTEEEAEVYERQNNKEGA